MERVHNGMKIAYKQMKRAHKQMKGAHKDDCGTNLFCTWVSDGFPCYRKPQAFTTFEWIFSKIKVF